MHSGCLSYKGVSIGLPTLYNACAYGVVRSIIQFREVFLTPDYLAIAMEFAPGGDMFQYVKRKKGLQARVQPYVLQRTTAFLGRRLCDRLSVSLQAHGKGLYVQPMHTPLCLAPSSWKNASSRHKALVTKTFASTSSPVWKVNSQILPCAGARGQVVFPAAHCRARLLP